MKRKTLLLGVLSVWAGSVRATMVVIDPAHIAQDAANEIVNLAKYAATEISAAETQVNTLNSYKNSLIQLARMGDAASLRSLPGIDEVTSLAATGQQVMQEYQQLQSYTNPQTYQATLNNI